MRPCEEIKRCMSERGWLQADLAFVMGCPVGFVSRLVTGKQRITPRTAVLLGGSFGDGAFKWIQLETSERLANTPPNEEKYAAIRARAAAHEAGQKLPKCCTKCGQTLPVKEGR